MGLCWESTVMRSGTLLSYRICSRETCSPSADGLIGVAETWFLFCWEVQLNLWCRWIDWSRWDLFPLLLGSAAQFVVLLDWFDLLRPGSCSVGKCSSICGAVGLIRLAKTWFCSVRKCSSIWGADGLIGVAETWFLFCWEVQLNLWPTSVPALENVFFRRATFAFDLCVSQTLMWFELSVASLGILDFIQPKQLLTRKRFFICFLFYHIIQ
jgi:hypothetical protein